MTMQARMRARAELQKALADVLPMDPQDGRIVALAAAIEDLIDAKVDQVPMFGVPRRNPNWAMPLDGCIHCKAEPCVCAIAQANG